MMNIITFRLGVLTQLKMLQICGRYRHACSRLLILSAPVTSNSTFKRHLVLTNTHICTTPVTTVTPLLQNTTAFHVCQRLRNTDSPRITQKKRPDDVILIEDQDGVMLGKMTRKEGEELATERGFHLLEEKLPKRSAKTEDGVPKYKLVKELPSKSQKKPAKKKMLKQLKLRSKISDHDLAIKLKHVDEWLRKEHEVIVSLENADPSNPKKMKMVFEAVIDASKELAIMKQAEKTEQYIRFYLRPKLSDITKHKVPDLLKIDELKKIQTK